MIHYTATENVCAKILPVDWIITFNMFIAMHIGLEMLMSRAIMKFNLFIFKIFINIYSCVLVRALSRHLDLQSILIIADTI